MGIFDKFVRAYRVHDTQTYRETIACVEKVASVSLGSLAGKSEEEKTQLIRRITDLSEKLHNAIDSETPLVIALTLLTAIRVHEQTMYRVASSTASGR
jgi:phenylpyruvate tautomerase PptA (4-oxalocrotonate tautomerase family)